MKKIILLVFLALPFASFAQTGPGGLMRENRLQSLEIAFLTRELALTPAEAEKFWPVHNAYMAELKKARQDNKSAELAFEEQALSIRKKYNNDFKKILNSEERVNTVFKLDRNFNDMMRQEMMKRGMKPRGPEGRPDRPELRKRLMQRNRTDSTIKND